MPDATTGQVGQNQPDVLPIVHCGATAVHQESQPEQPFDQTFPSTRFGPRSRQFGLTGFDTLFLKS